MLFVNGTLRWPKVFEVSQYTLFAQCYWKSRTYLRGLERTCSTNCQLSLSPDLLIHTQANLQKVYHSTRLATLTTTLLPSKALPMLITTANITNSFTRTDSSRLLPVFQYDYYELGRHLPSFLHGDAQESFVILLVVLLILLMIS